MGSGEATHGPFGVAVREGRRAWLLIGRMENTAMGNNRSLYPKAATAWERNDPDDPRFGKECPTPRKRQANLKAFGSMIQCNCHRSLKIVQSWLPLVSFPLMLESVSVPPTDFTPLIRLRRCSIGSVPVVFPRLSSTCLRWPRKSTNALSRSGTTVIVQARRLPSATGKNPNRSDPSLYPRRQRLEHSCPSTSRAVLGSLFPVLNHCCFSSFSTGLILPYSYDVKLDETDDRPVGAGP